MLPDKVGEPGGLEPPGRFWGRYGGMEEIYRSCMAVAVAEAKRLGVDEDEAVSIAGSVFMAVFGRCREGIEDPAGFFRVSVRNALVNAAKAASREIPVDPEVILEAVHPDGQPVRDVEAKVWWEQLLERAKLTPRQREAAELLGFAALVGFPPPRLSRFVLRRLREKLRQTVLGGG